MNQKFLRPSEAAAEIDVSKKTILRMIQDEELKAIRVRGGYRIYRNAFELWIRQHEVKKIGRRLRAAHGSELSVLPNRTGSSAVQADNFRDISQQSSSVEVK